MRPRGSDRRQARGVWLLLFALLIPVLPVMPVQAATRCVNPGGTGGCLATIQAAVDASSAGDTITVSAGTYPEHITINTPGTGVGAQLTLTGAGAGVTIIDGTQSGTVLTIGQDVAVTISDMTISNGKFTQCLVKDHNGSYLGAGGILNTGVLTLNASTVSANSGGVVSNPAATCTAESGGIFNINELAMTGSTVSDNTSTSYAGGLTNTGSTTLTDSVFRRNHLVLPPGTSSSRYGVGGIFNDRFMVMLRDIVSDNTALDENGNPTYGGGITNDERLFMTDTTITGNTGSGLYNYGLLSVTGSTISGNHAVTGGGINSPGEMSVANTIISNNSATGDGGGMSGGHARLSNVTVRWNTAGGNGGGLTIYGNMNNVTVRENTAGGNGGGIYATGAMTLSGSTISGNAAMDGGGIYAMTTDGVNLVNSTLSGNRATGSGGGLLNSFWKVFVVTSIVFPITGYYVYYSGVAALTQSTVSNNSGGNGSGLVNAGTVNISDSIVAGNVGSPDTSGYFTSGGHNLVGNASGGSGFTGTGDLTNLDARLAPLADNGGPTQTHALLPGSPALDAVPVTGGYCQPTDQRGIPRPQAAACDIGAYEAQLFPLPVPKPTVAPSGVPTPLPPPRATAPVVLSTPNPLPPRR